MTDINVDVIVVNWNGKKIISECLDALLKQTFQQFCITVVDNGSTDGSVNYIQTAYPEINIISLEKNFGFSIANNIVIKNSSAEYCALINNDAVPHEEWLDKLVTALEKNSGVGFAASKMLFSYKPDEIDRVGDAYTWAGVANLRGRGEQSDLHNDSELIFGACAGAALYRTVMFKDIGFFDEDFFLIYEDVDLSFRAQLRGYKCLFVPDAIVFHKVSKSIKKDSPVSIYYGHRNLEWVYIQNMPCALIIKTIIPHILYDFLSFLYFTVTGNLKPFAKAKWHAIKGIPKALNKRKKIQQSKKVSDHYIWELFEPELFISRIVKHL